MLSIRIEEVSNGYIVTIFASGKDELVTFYENKAAAIVAAQAYLQKQLEVEVGQIDD